MCGIVGYIGHREAYPVIIKGLQRLEYRGYDSAGIALLKDDQLAIFKKAGKVADLQNFVNGQSLESQIGIGHTRWATHGEPNDINAHPHVSSSGKLAIIHNGIIENYSALRKELEAKGHTFSSKTDTEVLIHFIEDVYENHDGPLEEAVRIALNRVVGAYGILILNEDEPDTLIAVRKGSPLVVGIGESEYLFASDASPIIEYTKDVVYLNDNDIAIIRDGKLTIRDISYVPQTPYIQTLDMELEAIEKGGYDHFMLKEIFEQPRSVRDCLRGRLQASAGKLVLGGIHQYADKLYHADRIIMLGCGTSYYAGMVAEYFFEEVCRIPVEVEYASEFRYRNPIIRRGDAVIAISQSGETADTLTAMELAKGNGATVFGVCNVVGSSIARMSHEGVYTHAGPEIGVASTKAFTAQLTVLSMIALKIAKARGTLSMEKYQDLLSKFEGIPDLIEETLELQPQIEEISRMFTYAKNFLYLGRGYNYPVAMEGALKLKEISYIHAEGYPAAEMKHGPIALIDEEMPVVVIATQDSAYEKVVSNIQEVKSRKGRVMAVITKGDTYLKEMVDYALEIPACHEVFTPLISVIPLQLLAYYTGINKGCNVDQPRNLAKSVTVE